MLKQVRLAFDRTSCYSPSVVVLTMSPKPRSSRRQGGFGALCPCPLQSHPIQLKGRQLPYITKKQTKTNIYSFNSLTPSRSLGKPTGFGTATHSAYSVVRARCLQGAPKSGGHLAGRKSGPAPRLVLKDLIARVQTWSVKETQRQKSN